MISSSILRAKPFVRFIVFSIVFILISSLMTVNTYADEIPETNERGWVDFILICNEGMSNMGGNVGNTQMIVSMNPKTGKIKLLMFAWDSFIRYSGYDLPQKLDMPYRNNGPKETMRVFNDNFNMDIKLFMSLNYLNLSSLISEYGGVDIDISRAERNALNGMVASKKETIQQQVGSGLLSQILLEGIADENYLSDYGPDTHLNGLQAVGYGWLQYDSVYNCCNREAKVISNLFKQVGKKISEEVALYTNDSGEPENLNSRRAINLDDMTEEDLLFLRSEMAPIFQMAYHNLSEDDIQNISNALARAAYIASRQGVNIFDAVSYRILPLEATQEYDIVGGAKGHIVDNEANEKAIKDFLFADEEF
ncbi:MAG: LCP family protein [Clostridiales bacterium]|nr:LCP family protein [Clostridiales bacterium]